MDNPSVITMINSGFTFATVIFTGMMAYATLRLNLKADANAKMTHDIHTLVNSNMGIQLKLASTLADRIAELTKDPKDILYAVEAKRLYEVHETQQSIVDSIPESPPVFRAP